MRLNPQNENQQILETPERLIIIHFETTINCYIVHKSRQEIGQAA